MRNSTAPVADMLGSHKAGSQYAEKLIAHSNEVLRMQEKKSKI